MFHSTRVDTCTIMQGCPAAAGSAATTGFVCLFVCLFTASARRLWDDMKHRISWGLVTFVRNVDTDNCDKELYSFLSGLLRYLVGFPLPLFCFYWSRGGNVTKGGRTVRPSLWVFRNTPDGIRATVGRSPMLAKITSEATKFTGIPKITSEHPGPSDQPDR